MQENFRGTLRSAWRSVALAVFVASPNAAIGQAACDFSNQPGQYGPYDYVTEKSRLGIVEQHHFAPQVENLVRGQTGHIAGDLAYTLRAFPNHHRALVSLMNLGFRLKTDLPPGTSIGVACFFERAIRFRPEDAMVRVIFGSYLFRHGNKDQALKQLELAQELGASGANFHYNLGLAYFEVGQFEKSLKFAHLAYEAGFNLPGLKGKLQKAGKWREPAPAEKSGSSPPGGNPEAKSMDSDKSEVKQ